MNTANITRQLKALDKQQAALDAKRNAINKSVSALVRKLRIQRNKQLRNVADALGCCISTYWCLENGKFDWTPEIFAKAVAAIKEGQA